MDQNDYSEIGNSLPRLQYGALLTVGFRQFDLMISGYGAGQYDVYLNNAYYRPQPENAYYASVRESFNLQTGTGTRPRLSADGSSNNYRLSDYWLANGSYFKIKEAEVSYSLPTSASNRLHLSGLRFYVRGNNLMTLSSIQDVDPEYINAGFTSYPFIRTVSFGLNIRF